MPGATSPSVINLANSAATIDSASAITAPATAQNPLLSGYSATFGYLPSQNVGISVGVTYLPGAFDCEGNYPNSSDTVFRAIGRYIALDDALPTVPPFTRATC